MPISIIIETLTEDHYPQVVSIFKQGILGGNATFDSVETHWESWDRGHLAHTRFVAKFADQVVGWVALSSVSERCVFEGVAELSVYIHNDFQGKGIGNTLMCKAIFVSESEGIWTLQSGIFPDNIPSIRLHEKQGFRRVGFRDKIGKMPDGTWRDIVIMERRSLLL
ncbi:MAG: N-acetyltransferase [Flavobacteriales bacterium]|nr:MAG: N-acetyltransferase [Flavobacteriales bacterium]